MSKESFLKHLQEQVEGLKASGLYKEERVITSSQSAHIDVAHKKVVNLCANNYLGLANHPVVLKAAQEALETHGFGMASVRFICGTQDIHKTLEEKVSAFLEMEDTLLYSSCFDANGGLFETLLSEEDAIISDSLNHASIIDGIRLCKAQRFRYANNDMAELEEALKKASHCRYKLIATDGVFSMDGIIANLKGICDLADRYDALVMVDDCHATGFLGTNGKGSHEHCGVLGRVDILTGTFGKALGGASGGYVSARKEIVAWLRQRSRPYLFSNSLAPPIVAASIAVFNMLETDPSLRKKLMSNAQYFRSRMENLGFNLVPGTHPIIPVMLGDAKLATEMSKLLLEEGIYVIGFSYPVVPQGKARIRTQMSAALEQNDLDLAVEAFAKVGRRLGVIN